jgi:uncharacterized protein with HEPN domain
MEREPRSLLWDARSSADAILRFVGGKSLEAYLADDMLRPAVERHFEIIGEALGGLARTDPRIAARIPDLGRAVAFRNLLVHGYAVIDDAIVWRVAREDLPLLRDAIAALLNELDGAPP